jgi:hypothetical protein
MQPYRLGINVGIAGKNISSQFRTMTSHLSRFGKQAGTSAGGVGLLSYSWKTFRAGLTNLPQLGSRLTGFFTNTRSSLQSFGKSLFSLQGLLAGVGIALSAGAFYNGLIGTNAALEQQSLSMSGVLNANLVFRDSTGQLLGPQESFQKSLLVSQDLMAKFRKDAIFSVGTSQDLIDVATLAMQPVLSAGGTLDTVRSIANDAVSVGKVAGIDASQSSRDIMQILGGNAGIEVATFRFLKPFLGDTETFNKLTAPERLAKLQTAMKQFATPELIAAQANSWSGLTSSLSEYLNLFVTTAGTKLFEKVKAGALTVVTFLTNNYDKFVAIAERVGNGIARAFDRVKPVMNFFINTFDKVNQFMQANPVLANQVTDGLTALAGVVGILTVGAAAFMGLGLGTILVGIGLASNKVAAGAAYLHSAWLEAGGGVQGVLTVLKNAFEGLSIVTANFFDNLKLSFFTTVRDIGRQIESTPFIGKFLGFTGDQLGLSSALDSQIAMLNNNINARGGSTWSPTISIQNTISTTDPQAAADAVNRTTERAVQKSVPTERLGTSLTLQPR